MKITETCLATKNDKLNLLIFSTLALIFTGYTLRGMVGYNFESILLLVVIGFIYLFFKGDKLLKNNALFIFTFILLAYLLASSLSLFAFHSIADLASHKLNLLFLILGFVCLVWLIYNVQTPIDYFWYFLIYASLIMISWAFLELSAQYERILSGSFRLGDVYSNPIKFGVYANALFIIMLGGIVWAYKKSKYLLVLWFSLILINFTMVVLAQSRTAWIGWPEAIIGWGSYYLFLLWRSSFSTVTKVLITLAPIFIVISILLNPKMSSVFDNRVSAAVENVSSYSNNEKYNTSIGLRLMMYESAWIMIKERPLVGYGPDAFSIRFKEVSKQRVKERFGDDFEGFKFSHVHNQFLMTWVQYGLVAFLFLVLLFMFLLVYFLSGIKKSGSANKPIYIAGFVFTLATLLGFMPESPLEFASYSAHYLFFLSILFAFSLNQGLVVKTQLIQNK